MQIKVFAVLKDFYQDLENPCDFQTVAEVKSYLIRKNPAASLVLDSCRFAVNSTFVDLNTKIKSNDTIYVMPPSSGG